MFKKLRKLFARKEKAATGCGCDEFMMMCAMEAFKTGNMVIGNRESDGTMTMESIPLKKE